jgi:hypothetical protein
LDIEDKHTYTLLTATKYVKIVQVDGKSFLKAKDGSLDYETMDKIQVLIRSEDSGTPRLSIEQTIVVTVVNVNEKPVVRKLSNNEVC